MEMHFHQQEKPEIRAVRSIWSMTWVRLLFIFFLGIVTGFLIFAALKQSEKVSTAETKESNGLSAVIQPDDSLSAPEILRYDTPLARATCKVRYSLKNVEIRVELSSLYPVKSLIEFDVNCLSILDVRHASVNDASTSMIASNFIQFNNVGDNIYILHFSNKNSLPHKIDFTVSQNDLTIYKNSVMINSN